MAYVLLAYGVSGAYWWPLVLAGEVVDLQRSDTQFPGLLGPALAAFAVTAVTEGRSGVRALAARLLRWRVPARCWLFAVGSPLALVGVALVICSVGPGLPDLADFGRMAGLPDFGLIFVWAMLVVVNGVGEETGWRGFAMPLLRHRHGLSAATLLLVPIWAGWHLPLFFLLQELPGPGTGRRSGLPDRAGLRLSGAGLAL